MIITKEQVFQSGTCLFAAINQEMVKLVVQYTPLQSDDFFLKASAAALDLFKRGCKNFQTLKGEPVQIQAPPPPPEGRIYSIPLRFECDQTITVEAPDLRTAMLEAISNASITPKEMVENGIYQDQDSIRIWREGVEEIYSQEAASTDWEEIPQTGD